MSLNTLTASDFRELEFAQPGLWLVEFGGPWCPPCRVIAPVLKDLAQRYAGRLSVAEVNADEQPELSTRFQVSAVPTLLLFRDGELIDRRLGAASLSTLARWIEEALE